MQTGQIVWDDYRKVLVMHYSTIAMPTGRPSGTAMEWKSYDLGETWGSMRNLTEHIAGADVLETGTSAGAALQLSPLRFDRREARVGIKRAARLHRPLQRVLLASASGAERRVFVPRHAALA